MTSLTSATITSRGAGRAAIYHGREVSYRQLFRAGEWRRHFIKRPVWYQRHETDAASMARCMLDFDALPLLITRRGDGARVLKTPPAIPSMRLQLSIWQASHDYDDARRAGRAMPRSSARFWPFTIIIGATRARRRSRQAHQASP